MNTIKNLKLYFNKLLIRIKFQIWGYKGLSKLDSRFVKQYNEEIFHRNFMNRLLASFDKMPKYDPNAKQEWYEKSWFVGEIPRDWENRLNAKIKEKENTNVVD